MREDPGSAPIESAGPKFDPVQVEYALEQLRGEQSLLMGLVAGTAAALVGAGSWAAVTVFSGYQIGWMAVGVGFLVGIAVRTAGKGIDKAFGVLGAMLALLGCAVGNLLAVVGMVADRNGMKFLDVLSGIGPGNAGDLMIASFSPMDLVFYGIAVYEGYKLSFRQLTDGDIAARVTGIPLN